MLAKIMGNEDKIVKNTNEVLNQRIVGRLHSLYTFEMIALFWCSDLIVTAIMQQYKCDQLAISGMGRG